MAAVDGNGNPILTPAQITSALASGNAPAGFLVAGTPVTTPDTGGLTVEGATSTNGIDNNGAKITNIATGTAATDAANVGNVTTAIDAAITTEAQTRADADKVLTDAVAAEATTRGDADKVLTDAVAAEATTRADADKVLTDAGAAEAKTRADADKVLTDAVAAEAKTRADADKVLTDAGAAEAKTRADADKVLTDAGAAEAKTRADADKVLTDAGAAEAKTRADADTKLTTDLGTEVTNRTKADTALETKIDTKMVAAAAETSKVISKKANGAIHIGENSLITQEVGGVQELYAQDAGLNAININVTNGSDLLVGGVSVATDADVAAERTARISGDNVLRSEYQAGDNALRSEYQAADRGLSSRIDKNTRGIAMVAAMTNSTIEAGKNHAVDFNAATFDGESGFAFGYAQRVNENLQLHGAASTTSDCEESAVRLGVSIQW